jgi:[pyruvate, water dikinase]-phosphate phosphotransferase / [pyruvate, water dikinase] kinase
MIKNVYIVSDGTGKTAEFALNAALLQFAGVEIDYKRRPGVNSKEQIDQIIFEAKEKHGFIIHTLVSDKMRDYMLQSARYNDVETIDIMGPLLSRLSNLLEVSPTVKPGLFNHLNEEYFRRVETMNFAFKHDDGLRMEDLKKAEIVLVGVSRTFKTPLSIYLAFKRWLVANVPIVYNMEPQADLFEINPQKVFCLTTTPKRLSELRTVRHERLGSLTGDYSTYNYVRQELLFAQKIYNRNPDWSVISVTNKSIEEIASEIIALMRTGNLAKYKD